VPFQTVVIAERVGKKDFKLAGRKAREEGRRGPRIAAAGLITNLKKGEKLLPGSNLNKKNGGRPKRGGFFRRGEKGLA